MNYIYALKDPIEHTIRYIGKTTNLSSRFSFHVNDKSKTHKVNWIKNLKNKNLLPYMEILEEVETNWQDREKFYISKYRKIYPLTNLTDGGDGAKGLIPTQTKPVDCYTLKGVYIRSFSSISEAAKTFNIKASHISYCCKHKLKSAGNMLWVYKGERLNNAPLNKKAKPIIQESLKGVLIREYSSITEAAFTLNCKPSNISRVLRGLRKKFRNSVFKYKDIV